MRFNFALFMLLLLFEFTVSTSETQKWNYLLTILQKDPKTITQNQIKSAKNIIDKIHDNKFTDMYYSFNPFRNGDTALIRASDMGHLEIVKYLIQKGSNINTPNK